LGADLSFLAQKIKATQHYDPISSNLYQSYLSYHSNSLTLDSEAFAATTLLLSLHLQRHERPKQTRRVFINFFKVLGAHSSHPPLFGVTVDFNINRIRHATRVLQAWGLFEAQQGDGLGGEVLREVVMFDPTLHPVLKWQVMEKRKKRDLRKKEKVNV